ncbi:MAG: DUF167 domain-containing protein [Chloroflexi bacterium]|nr:DUF167 domain-containing protein [Chloroflexota bacterium]
MSVRVLVRLTPRAGRDSVEGVDAEGRLRVRVAAPPIDGAANDALVRLLSAALDVPRSGVSIETGATARLKRVRIEGMHDDALAARWPGIVVS